MTAPAYNEAGMLFALGARFARLGPDGSPLVGPENSYVTDSLIQVQLGLSYEDGEQILQRNGSGNVCLTYQAPSSLTGGTITGLQFCTPDPYAMEFLIGGSVIEGTDGRLGYQAPEVGGDPNPNGVSVEFFSRQIIDGAPGEFWHWVLPRAYLRPSGEWTVSGTDPTLPEFEGDLKQNPNWGDGPGNDFPFPSERVWQYMQIEAIPELLSPPRFLPVETELTTTTVTVTPASTSIAVDQQEQLTAEATMSDASTRDVTQQAVWDSDTPATVSVDDEGLITGEAAGGPINVNATYGGQTGSSAVTVTA